MNIAVEQRQAWFSLGSQPSANCVYFGNAHVSCSSPIKIITNRSVTVQTESCRPARNRVVWWQFIVLCIAGSKGGVGVGALLWYQKNPPHTHTHLPFFFKVSRGVSPQPHHSPARKALYMHLHLAGSLPFCSFIIFSICISTVSASSLLFYCCCCFVLFCLFVFFCRLCPVVLYLCCALLLQT